MKNNKFFHAICVMAVAIIVSIAVVSCKKETQNNLMNNKTETSQAFNPLEIEDMNAYLKDFKQKMQSAVKGDDEALSIEDAAWHLSSLANVNFCRVNVEYNDFQFDTIEMQVNVTNGVMLMSDLCSAYGRMCTEIQQYKKGFKLPNQNLYFIKISIGNEGNAKIALMTSYSLSSKGLYDHQWYFSDVFEANDACYEYYSDDSTYIWNDLGAKELQRVLNLYDHHENSGSGELYSICYIPTRDHTFDYTNTHDPYGSEFYYINDSRVFAKRYYNNPNPYYEFSVWEMCYLLDSYLGLGYDYIDDHLYAHEFPVNWTVISITFKNTNVNTPFYNYTYIYHQLHMEYGRALYVDN